MFISGCYTGQRFAQLVSQRRKEIARQVRGWEKLLPSIDYKIMEKKTSRGEGKTIFFVHASDTQFSLFHHRTAT